jgi:hypothetical protein
MIVYNVYRHSSNNDITCFNSCSRLTGSDCFDMIRSICDSGDTSFPVRLTNKSVNINVLPLSSLHADSPNLRYVCCTLTVMELDDVTMYDNNWPNVAPVKSTVNLTGTVSKSGTYSITSFPFLSTIGFPCSSNLFLCIFLPCSSRLADPVIDVSMVRLIPVNLQSIISFVMGNDTGFCFGTSDILVMVYLTMFCVNTIYTKMSRNVCNDMYDIQLNVYRVPQCTNVHNIYINVNNNRIP